MTKRTARRDAPAEPRNGRCGARRSLAPDIRPGRAAGGFRRGPDGGCFLLASRRAGHGGDAGAVERRETHRGSARRRGCDAILRIRPADAASGAFGIAEPGPEAQTCDPSEIDLVIVPGTAFTAAGARCGRGRGYYDKYLSRPDVHAVKVGVCFAHQLVGELPAEPHDVAMDYIITD